MQAVGFFSSEYLLNLRPKSSSACILKNKGVLAASCGRYSNTDPVRARIHGPKYFLLTHFTLVFRPTYRYHMSIHVFMPILIIHTINNHWHLVTLLKKCILNRSVNINLSLLASPWKVKASSNPWRKSVREKTKIISLLWSF